MAENWCTPKPKLTERPLLDTDNAEGLSETFKILSNGTRLRILHTLIRTPNFVNEHTISAHQFQINPAYHLK